MAMLELPAPPPPAQPVLPTKAQLYLQYFCVLGPKHPHHQNCVATFEHLYRHTQVHHMGKDRVMDSSPSILFIPIDPFTLVRLGVVSWEDLGYPEMTEAYTKLMSIA